MPPCRLLYFRGSPGPTPPLPSGPKPRRFVCGCCVSLSAKPLPWALSRGFSTLQGGSLSASAEGPANDARKEALPGA